MYNIDKLITFVVALVLFLPSFVCAQDYFLKIPDIPGEATNAAFVDEICVTSFSWNVERMQSLTGGGGAAAATAAEFRFGKSFDRASPLLFGAVADGRRIADVTFSVVGSSANGGARKFAEYVLKNVLITGFQPGGETGSAPKEVITMVAEQVKVTHFGIRDDGSAGEETVFEWNFSSNTGG